MKQTGLVQPLDEACIWRQTRGTATETLGAENKAKSTEKVQLQFTNLPFRFLKYFINPILSYLSYRVCMFWDPCDQNFPGAPTFLPGKPKGYLVIKKC